MKPDVPFFYRFHHWVTLLLIVVSASACRVRQSGSIPREFSAGVSKNATLSQNEETAVKLLIAHCKACHAVGEHRFLDLQDTPATWKRLFTDRSTKSGGIWAEQIIKSLDWPNDVPPNSDQRYAKDFRYMPIGAQRGKLHAAKVGNESARQFLINTLRHGF